MQCFQQVLECSNLPPTDWSTGLTDPFVKVNNNIEESHQIFGLCFLNGDFFFLCAGLPAAGQEAQVRDQGAQEEPQPQVRPDLRVQEPALRVSQTDITKKKKTTLHP